MRSVGRLISSRGWRAPLLGAVALLACVLSAQAEDDSPAKAGAAPLASPVISGATPSALDVLKSLTQSIAGGIGEVEFLDPDAAFMLLAEVEDADTITVRWQIADGYYLYRKRFGFTPAEGSDIALGSPQLPAGKIKVDDYFGEMEVYYHDVLARLPVQREAGSATSFALDVVYQG